MEDYDIFNEMQNINYKKIIMYIEDDEDFVMNNLLNNNYELIPIRFSYDLSNFSDEYIKKTKNLFIYYFDENNTFKNEQVRIKKHFIHYQRYPFIAYIPLDSKYEKILNLLKSLNIECISDKTLFIRKIENNSKLIFLDSDDTLRDSKGEITSRIHEAIKKNIEIGNKVIIATSRPRYLAIDITKKANASKVVVSSNGAEIYDMDLHKILHNKHIKTKDVISFIEIAYQEDVRLIISVDDYDYVTKEPRNKNQILLDNNNYVNQIESLNVKQCMFIDEKTNSINKIKNLIQKYNVAVIDEISNEDTYYEKWFSVANTDVSKGNALLFLADYFGIPIKNTFAIGNGKNDISMFEIANISIAVENASNDIKEKVDYITSNNDSDGVAIVLEKIINNEQF